MKRRDELSSSPGDLKEMFESAYRGEVIATEIHYHSLVTSTNEEALRIGRMRKDPEGIVVIADSQSHGRGRLGRKWISPPGVNLYLTALLRPPFEEKDAPLLVLMAAVAVVTAIRRHTGLKAEIKWPNDILVNGKKTGGILLETQSSQGGRPLIAVGIGINVNMPLHMLPHDMRAGVTSIREEGGRDIVRMGLLREVLALIEEWYKVLLHGDRTVLLREWSRLDATAGRMITLKMTPSVAAGDGESSITGCITGMAEGIDSEGRLLIRGHSGKMVRMSAGDVTILKSE
jgi:BirA family biotin operon repressor/biotin-[acetyl-CoA-carboxylase] ligase